MMDNYIFIVWNIDDVKEHQDIDRVYVDAKLAKKYVEREMIEIYGKNYKEYNYPVRKEIKGYRICNYI